MGANATTFVPAYVSGEVLTAADLTVTNSGIPVFADSTARDAAFGGTGEKVLAEGQYAYLESDNSTAVYDGSNWIAVGASGMVLVATATASSVTSVSINNCFTSTYENYRVLLATTAATSAADLSLRLRVGGVDTTTNYTSQLTEAFTTSVVTNYNIIGADEFYLGRIDSAQLGQALSFDIYRPQTAQKTAYNGSNVFTSGTPVLISQLTAGVQTDSTQFDGFTVLRSANFSGVIRVYGYANS